MKLPFLQRFGTFESAPYLVSELLEGGTLGQQLARGPLATGKAIDYAVRITCGFAAAHDKGIVHRDLKLGNIFAIKDGRKSRRTARCRLKLPEDLVNEEASTPFLHGSYCVAGGY